MRLATLRDGSRDGRLIVVSRDSTRYQLGSSAALTMQGALDRWETVLPALQSIAESVERAGEPLDVTQLHAPLPRAYEWVDGSAYINHIVLVRRARNAEPPETLLTDPLVYQGGSGVLLGPTDDIELPDPSWGLDFESEVCVILGDTPRGVRKEDAARYVRLVTICNDVTLRNLIPAELQKGFGFFQSKPATAFAPFAVTPDELGSAWRDGRLHLTMRTTLNGTLAGDPHAGPEMHFSFYDLIAHIARTRAYTAGTILGSGTVSNEDRARGVSCLAERRMREIIDTGAAVTPFLKSGDHIAISMCDESGRNLFGTIEQHVKEVS